VKSHWTRAIVMTPGYSGVDGVSAVTRAYVNAVCSWIPRVDVWALDEEPGSPIPDGASRLRGARGHRVLFGSYGVMERDVDRQTLVIVQHVHLLPAVLPLIARGARVLVVLHGIEAWTRLRRFGRAACRRAWKLAPVSSYTARLFRAANPEVSPVPMDVCAPGLPNAPVPSATVGYGLYALIVGRMRAAEQYKGHDELLEVWPAVRSQVPGASLVIAGGGDDRARLQQKASALGLDEAVFFEGVVDDARLQALYRSAALFAMPSSNEGFGLVYVEAMRAGLPCIVAPGAAEEIVEHERTGLVVPARDRASIERALVRLLTHPVERAAMGRAAQAAAARFTADAFRSRLAALLEVTGYPLRAEQRSAVGC
jgi:phosphatidylinositol alpha-1,6-mannosyltransferase